MDQLSFFGTATPQWIDAKEQKPMPGATILKYFFDDKGELVGPTTSPVYPDDMLINGKPILRPAAYWMPIPRLPATMQNKGIETHEK